MPWEGDAGHGGDQRVWTARLGGESFPTGEPTRDVVGRIVTRRETGAAGGARTLEYVYDDADGTGHLPYQLKFLTTVEI